MPSWKIAAVQMDCKIAEKKSNLETCCRHLEEAAGQGAQLVVFPECIVTGYCFESKEEAWGLAEPVPGPSTDAIGETCRRLKVWAVFGLLEQAGDNLFNVCALAGPHGYVASYRKVHLPYLGVDRFTTPGDRPFAVHDLGGLRIGMNICYDGSFPEAARVLMLEGADLIVLPTNWPPGATTTAQYLIPARALENQVFYAAVNRVGEERGFRFIGQSQILACSGEKLADAGDQESIIYADIDPARARDKRLVKIPGQYELDRIRHRRPEMYGAITRPLIK